MPNNRSQRNKLRITTYMYAAVVMKDLNPLLSDASRKCASALILRICMYKQCIFIFIVDDAVRKYISALNLGICKGYASYAVCLIIHIILVTRHTVLNVKQLELS